MHYKILKFCSIFYKLQFKLHTAWDYEVIVFCICIFTLIMAILGLTVCLSIFEDVSHGT